VFLLNSGVGHNKKHIAQLVNCTGQLKCMTDMSLICTAVNSFHQHPPHLSIAFSLIPITQSIIIYPNYRYMANALSVL